MATKKSKTPSKSRKISATTRKPRKTSTSAKKTPPKGMTCLEIVLLVVLASIVAYILGVIFSRATPLVAQPQNICGQARDLGPWAPTSDGIGETFEVTSTLDDSTGIVLGLWFPDGNTPWGKKEITTFIEPGLSIEVQNGAGRGFDYPEGCSSAEVDRQLADHIVQRKLDTTYNGFVDVDELIRLGLVKVRFDRRDQ